MNITVSIRTESLIDQDYIDHYVMADGFFEFRETVSKYSFVAEINGFVVGVIRLSPLNIANVSGIWYVIDLLTVIPLFRGFGIAREMIEWVICYFRELQIDVLCSYIGIGADYLMRLGLGFKKMKLLSFDS